MRQRTLPGLALAAATIGALGSAAQGASQAMAGFGGLLREKRRRRTAKIIDRYKNGKPHGHSGDKLLCRAIDMKVGLTKPRGLLLSWASARAGQRRHPFSSTKR